MGALQGGLYLKAKIKGYAKINLLLDVLRKRNDGYHDVQMIMQAIDLYDEIIIQPAETNRQAVALHPEPFGPGVAAIL